MNEVTLFIAGPIIGMLSIILAYLGYKRGSRADDVAEENSTIALVYTGYSGLLKHLQDDNIELRRRLADTEIRLAQMEKRIIELLDKLAKQDM